MYGADIHFPEDSRTSSPPVESWCRRVKRPESVCGVQLSFTSVFVSFSGEELIPESVLGLEVSVVG